MKKVGIVLLMLLMFPVFVSAEAFNTETGRANSYLQRDAFSSSYKKYLLYSNLRFGFDNGRAVNNSNFYMGGFISEQEYRLTIPQKGSSYLLSGDAYWTLTPNGSKYRVIEYNGNNSNELSSYQSNSEFPRSRITEYVAPNVTVSGTGKLRDPWYFDPMFRVNFIVLGGHGKIEGSTENIGTDREGTTLSNIYLKAKCKEDACTKTIKILLDEGYDVVSNDCDGTYNSDTKTFTVNYITKDLECKLKVGTGKFTVELTKGNWIETKGPKPSTLYLRQRDNYYKEKSYVNIVNKLDQNPERYGYTFKGYYIPNTTIRIIDGTGKVIDKTSITKNEKIISDWQKNKYTITFDPNGGNINVNEKTKIVTFDEAYGTLPSATRAGYSFVGWYTSATNNEKITSSQIVKYAGNRTLFAHWTICPENTYNDGSLTVCTACPTEYKSPKGSTLKKQCYVIVSPGKYLVAGNSSTSFCQKGTARDGEVKKYFGEGILCDNCSAGYYQDEKGKTSCKKCPIGYTSGIKATADTQCFINVPSGNKLIAKSTPTQCEAGTFRKDPVVKNFGEGINCDTCAPGTNSDKGAASCKTCSNNANVASWSTLCNISACKTDYVINNNKCILACSSVTYKDGTTCTKKCGSGTYNRLAYSAYDGRRCSGNDQSSGGSTCNKQACCSSITYKDGSECTKKCDGGTYNKLAYSAYDGSRCSANDQSSGGSACNTQTCCSSTTTSYGNWGNWSGCSVSCGGGTQSRSRTNTNYSNYNGQNCGSWSQSESQSCNTHSCIKCYVYCTGPNNCSSHRPNCDHCEQMYGVFACDGSKTGAILECWHYYRWTGYHDDPLYEKCTGGSKNEPTTYICEKTRSETHYQIPDYCIAGEPYTGVKGASLSGSGYACSCN